MLLLGRDTRRARRGRPPERRRPHVALEAGRLILGAQGVCGGADDHGGLVLLRTVEALLLEVLVDLALRPSTVFVWLPACSVNIIHPKQCYPVLRYTKPQFEIDLHL